MNANIKIYQNICLNIHSNKLSLQSTVSLQAIKKQTTHQCLKMDKIGEANKPFEARVEDMMEDERKKE